ncbi:MAG: hypothetical protein HYU66_28135, partial [Armatimonadetes bacterium]|nr:hypothetical protein [Armatimonadota bacterium]
AWAVGTKDAEPEKEGEDKSKPTPPPADNGPRVRMVVVADGDFPTNMLAFYANLDLAANAVEWLTDNSKALGIRAKNPFDSAKERRITMDASKRRWVFLLTFVLPLVLVLAAGVAVQIARR